MPKTQLAIVLALIGAGAGLAQPMVHFPLAGGGGMGMMAGGGLDSKVVEGAPFTADAITEMTQTLADGNHIVHKQMATVARDSKGRTRREEVIAPPGSPAASGGSDAVAWINDPVAQSAYLLTGHDHIAHKMPRPGTSLPGGTMMSIGVAGVEMPGTRMKSIGDSKEEQLDSRIVEGLQAIGVRIRTTIQTGEIGNDRPIEITEERWTSPELGMVVLSKRTDPRFGESVYRLTNIQRTEPPASIFQIPAEYRLEEGGAIAGRSKP